MTLNSWSSLRHIYHVYSRKVQSTINKLRASLRDTKFTATKNNGHEEDHYATETSSEVTMWTSIVPVSKFLTYASHVTRTPNALIMLIER